MSQLPGLVLTLLFLVAWTAAAQPPAARTVRVRRVSLSGAAVEVRVAPGIPTTLNFDADVDPRRVELDAPERIKLLAVAPRAITLMPVAELGDAVTLRVRFADACLALEPDFSLRGDAAEVDAQVTTYRDERAPELLLAQVAELEARTATCEAEVAALRERGRGTGPASLVLSGQLGSDGVQVTRGLCVKDTRAGGMTCVEASRFLAEAWLVVSVTLRNPPGQPVWKPGRAWLVSEVRREYVPARVVVLAPEALAPESSGRLVVEFGRPPQRPGESYRVEVEDAAGTRYLLLEGVTVDDANQAGEKGHGP